MQVVVHFQRKQARRSASATSRKGQERPEYRGRKNPCFDRAMEGKTIRAGRRSFMGARLPQGLIRCRVRAREGLASAPVAIAVATDAAAARKACKINGARPDGHRSAYPSRLPARWTTDPPPPGVDFGKLAFGEAGGKSVGFGAPQPSSHTTSREFTLISVPHHSCPPRAPSSAVTRMQHFVLLISLQPEQIGI